MYFILYSNYKSLGYVLRGIKTVPRPQEFYRADTATAILKFLELSLIDIL